MKKTIKQRFFLSLCLLMLFSFFGGCNLAWAEGTTVTYTVSSTSEVTTSGTAPSRSSATFTNTYSTKDQLTKGYKMTLTLSGYAGKKITGLSLSMKSNKSDGAGYLDVKAGTKQLAAIGSSTSGVSFSNAAWNGKWSTSYVDVKVSLLDDTYIIQDGEDVVIVIGATANSLYCQSFELTYEAGGSSAPLPNYNVSWKVNGEPAIGNPSTSVKSGESVTVLPTEPAAIGTKDFVGWTNAQIAAAQSTAPTVLFTTPEDAPAVTDHVTYYAVFATQSDALTEVLSQTLAYDTWTYGGSTTNKGSYRLFHTGGYVQSKSFDLSTLTKVVVYGGTFGGDGYNTLEIGDGTNIWKTVKVSGKEETGVNTFTEGSPLSGEDVLKITSKSGTASDKGVRISKVDIYTLAHCYTDYVTTISSSAVTVTFNAGANGTCATASLTETAAGAGVTLPACVANEGYVFGGWSTSETPTSADAGQAGETYYPSADCTLYAYYKQQYTVTIKEPANGTIEVKHGENVVNSGDKFLAGDVLTITATPAEGYKFRYVQVEDGTPHTYKASNVKEWTMAEANITISAKFDEITYSTITKVVNGVSTPELVENGTEIPFANPDAASIPTGYVFMGWTETPVVGKQDDAPTLVSSPVTASTDATYYAVFAVSKRTGNEVWEEITTVPEPGTYAILSESYFMKAEITSSKRFAYGDATPEISTTSPATLTTAPASDCIWEITKPDEYYRIANGSQYAGGTSAKNEGALLDDASRDLAKWTIEHDGSEFSVSNYGRSIASKDKNNKYLRNNVSYGWACYGSGTGKAPRLFKKTNAMVLTDYCTTIPDVELAVGATGYATLYYSNFDLVVPENTEAYTFGSVDGALVESVTYAEGTVIPAGEAVVVYTANDVPCTLNFKKGIATFACDASSQLAGTDEKTAITPDADYYFYGLSLNSSNDINSVGFYWMTTDGAAFTNGAHKAYLKIPKSEFTGMLAIKGFAFNGTTTGVESVESSNHAPQVIYDLAGRRVSKAEKGIYIINGKKVIK